MLVSIGDVRLRVDVRGVERPGIPVVFLHGIGGDGGNWAPQLEALSTRRRVVAVDTRGFGGSEAGGRDVTLGEYADDVRGVLDALGIQQAHVVGLSMGGMMAQALALQSPERVAGLVLADTSARADERMSSSLKASGEAALEHGMSAVAEMFLPATFSAAAIEEDRAYVRVFRDGFSATDPLAFDTGLRAIAELDFLDRLGEIAVPTLVIAGSGDQLTPVAHSEAIATRTPHARLEILDGAGHLSNLDSAAEFTHLLTDFLEAR